MTEIVQSALLSTIPFVRHGTSMRTLGDARTPSNRSAILSRAGMSSDSFVGAEQVHGSEVVFLGDSVPANPVPGTDGLVTKTPGSIIGVRTADCAPLLFVDPVARVVSGVHAGWKGIINGIVKETIRVMVNAGATPQSLRVYVGPHIGACCYTVDKDRARLFQDRFVENGQWHVDIGAEVLTQLIEAGIPREHIDAPITCTSCQNDLFFSFRKDSKEMFGEMLSFITLTA